MKSSRIASIDVLRGFDLFLLVFFQPVLWSLGNQLDLPWLNAILYQFDHEVWEGFRFWDIVMPLFLFITGTTMPFSLSKYTDKKSLYGRIFRRVVVLFVLGMIVQGNLLNLKLQDIRIYTNTLQAIAVGYLIASMIQIHLQPKAGIAATAALLVIYWIPMTFCGDFSLEGSFAYKVDKVILGHFRGDLTYTWIWSSLNFGATVMLGSFAGRIIKEGSAGKEIVRKLLVIGIILIGAGLLWSIQMPIIKRLWTSSMTLFSAGICFILMALTYWLVDMKHCPGLNWLEIYGKNAILAYMLGEVINFRSIAHSVCYGLESYMGAYYSTWLTFANYLILFLILRFLYKHNMFFKV